MRRRGEEKGWFGGAGSHFPLLAGASPPYPNLPSAQVLPPLPSFNRHRAHPTPHLPAPLLGAKLQSCCDRGFPSRRSWWLLQRPGINYLPTRIAALLFPETPNFVPVSRSHSAFLRDSPRPCLTWRLPHPPLSFRGPRQVAGP